MINVADIYEAADRSGMLTAVTLGAVTVKCAFRAPDETVLDGLALSRDYHIEYPTVWLTLAIGNTVVVGGNNYRVREVRQIRDGSESVASLSRL